MFNLVVGKYPRLTFYAVLVFSFVMASGAGRKWAK
jgi:hypothetical protein